MIQISTIGWALLIFAGVLTVAAGMMVSAGGYMSSSPSESAKYANRGCVTFLVGIAIVIGGIWGLL